MEPYIIVSCPYNPSHRIQKYKLMSHIAKCKKSANTANKVECPLDKSHIVDQDHLREHIATCPSIGNLINMSTTYDQKEKDITVNKHLSSENWDEEPEVRSYNPMEASADKQVIRCIPGMSKAARRKFRESERMRVENLKAMNPLNTTSLSVNDTVQELPLRPPRGTSATLQNAETQETQVDSDKSQINNLAACTQAESNPEFQNLFFTTLYDKLDPECNDINQHSLYGTDMETSAENSKHTKKEKNREKKNLPFNQNHETEVKQKLNETYEIFNNLKKEKNECAGENISRASSRASSRSDRVTELLATLKGDIKKVKTVEEIEKISQNDKDLGEKGLKWDDVFKKFNDRLVYLTDIQNTAAEESARLLKQLNELKLREEAPAKK